MNLADLLFTKRCLCCEKVQTVTAPDICPECAEKLYPATISADPQAPFSYDGTAAIMLKKLKHKKEKLIRNFFADKMTEMLRQNMPPIDLITCIPRYNPKAYCQSAYLAKRIARKLRKPFFPQLLIKKRNNRSQTKCKSILQRRINVADIFRVNGYVSGRSVLLIDDIFTTGATIEAATKALQEAGAKVTASTAAKTPLLRTDRLQIRRDFENKGEDKTQIAKELIKQ